MAADARAALRLVPATTEAAQPAAWFCGHCGESPGPDVVPPPYARVCTSCELGLLLETRADALPAPGDAFLVVDGTLSVCAVSGQAERLLGATETDAVERPLTDLLTPADAESPDRHGLAGAVTWVAGGEEETLHVFVRPANMFGVRYRARIAPCGPPRAALIVLSA